MTVSRRSVSRRSFISVGSAAVAGALGTAGLLSGCGGGDDADGRREPGTDPVEEEPGRSPFTGEDTPPDQPVLAVKIDNAPQARPAAGLEHADLVYGLPVEGGISRLMAVFSSAVPPVVGPVRSMRESDLLLLAQFGRPAVAYSGAHSALLPELANAPLVPITPADSTAYFRDEDRNAPHNLYLRAPEALRDAAPSPGPADDVGFRFGAAPSRGEETPSVTRRYPAARWGFTWSATDARWLVTMDDAPATAGDGTQLSAATVVFQEVRLSRTALGDAATPFVETTGRGAAQVLRDGLSYEAKWERRRAELGTVFRTPSGDRIPFAPGPVWVIMLGE